MNDGYVFHKRFPESIEFAREDILKIRKIIHPNLWASLQNSIDDDIDSLLQKRAFCCTKLLDLTKKFPKEVIEELKKSIEMKIPFKYCRRGASFYFRVETRFDDKGRFIGIYEKEHADTGDALTYCIINYKYATFEEPNW